MIYYYENHKFKKIIDDFILSLTADDQQLSCIIKNIDYEATKYVVSFYHIIFILIHKDSSENRKKEMAKKKTGKLIIAFDGLLLTFFYIIDVGSLSIMKISHYVFSQISK